MDEKVFHTSDQESEKNIKKKQKMEETYLFIHCIKTKQPTNKQKNNVRMYDVCKSIQYSIVAGT